MANESLVNAQSFLSDAAITQYRAVEAGTDGDHVQACNSAGDLVIGICQNNPAAAEQEATIEIPASGGETKWEAAGAITINDQVGTSANGRCETKSTAGDFVYGRAMDAAAGAGDIIRVQLTDRILHA